MPCEYGIVSFDNGNYQHYGSYGSISWQIDKVNNSPLKGPGYEDNRELPGSFGRRLNVMYHTTYK